MWSADVDLDAWLARAVADVDGAQVPQGVADAGVRLGANAYEEFVENGLAAFLGQDAGDDAAGAGGAGAVAGGFDFAGFLSDGVQVPQGAADAGVLLGVGADGEFVANGLPAFLRQDAGDDAAGVGGAGSVAGGFDFSGFLPDYAEGCGVGGVGGAGAAD
ncbi:hypothetical protein [Saccharopolyspora spinosa]|uniref:hypothetical protein n=1 Tax=Saccharopolyspora spinosa TaxID=60894 RepID=UPI00130508D6|nr:hypothetical protein [Saccharopolyspora spinosa]